VFNDEHVIPEWVLRKFNLFNRTLTFPNGGAGSCPAAWCSFVMATTIAGRGRAGQVATAGSATMGLSLMGAMVSSVM
jgi:hypothetical protein